jgi:[acyl-carrier-protein] S-malonyltransferase
MTAAFLFPGQGEAIAPLLSDWYEQSESVRSFLDSAMGQVEHPVSVLIQRGGRILERTEVFQPVSTALSMGIVQELEGRGVRAAMVAGHSLGELPAAAAAGLMSPGVAVNLGAVRGRLMGREARRNRGGMVAVPTADPDQVQKIVNRASSAGSVEVAAMNSPLQTVLAAEEAAMSLLVREGIRLPVHGPWHSQAMAGATSEFREALSRSISGEFEVPMLFNRTGRLETEVSTVPDLLANQLTHPVRWTEVMQSLRTVGPCTIVTVGPSRSLRGLVRACEPSVNIIPVEQYRDLDHVERKLPA